VQNLGRTDNHFSAVEALQQWLDDGWRNVARLRYATLACRTPEEARALLAIGGFTPEEIDKLDLDSDDMSLLDYLESWRRVQHEAKLGVNVEKMSADHK